MDITDILNMSTTSLTELHEAISAELQDRTLRIPETWDEKEYQQLELIESRRRTGA